MDRTSASVLPILVEITRQENLDLSSDFKVLSFCFSSDVQVVEGLGERDGDLRSVRRRLVGALGVALAFCLRFGGVDAVDESFEGSGIASGGGALTCWWGSGRLCCSRSSMKASSSSRSGGGKCAASMNALVGAEYSGNRPSGWFQTPVLGSGAGSMLGMRVGGSNAIARCRRRYA